MAEMKEAHTHDAHIYLQFHIETVDKRSHALSPINYSPFLKVPVRVKFTLARFQHSRVCLQPAGELHGNEESPSFTLLCLLHLM